jgi:hypothetical protein
MRMLTAMLAVAMPLSWSSGLLKGMLPPSLELKLTRSAAMANHRASECASITIHCCNALEEAAEWYQNVTVFFPYLISRGLRLMLPVLLELAEKGTICVFTYMAPLPGLDPILQTHVEVEYQPGAQWPLFMFHIGR